MPAVLIMHTWLMATTNHDDYELCSSYQMPLGMAPASSPQLTMPCPAWLLQEGCLWRHGC
jgi:hypothetical protein